MIDQLTSVLYKLARASNKVKILVAIFNGNTKPIHRYLENRILWNLINKIKRY